MFKKGQKVTSKLLMLIMCTSLVLTTIAVLGGINVVYASATTVIAESDFTFDATTGTITKYNGGNTEIDIPSTINGVKVTSIGDYAFDNCGSLASIIIPNSVTSMGNYAFYNCGSLASIIIPNSVKSIGDYAFYNCVSLTSTAIPDSVTSIGDYAFDTYGNTKFYVGSEKVKQLLINYGVDSNKIVLNSQSSTIKVTSITLNNTSLSILKGNTSTLTATVAPSNTSNQAVTWSSSNTSVATVDSNGKITGVSAGTANITCTVNDGSKKTATCALTVTNPVSVTSVTLNNTSLSVVKGNTSTLTTTIAPTNASNKAVTWSSDNSKEATVDVNGKITGVSAGTANITCTANDGSKKSATCKVTVTSHVSVTSLKLNNTSLSVVKGNTSTLTATPTNATNQAVTWSSSNTLVATVDGSGKITGVGVGSVVITCKTNDGSKTATCNVTVTK